MTAFVKLLLVVLITRTLDNHVQFSINLFQIEEKEQQPPPIILESPSTPMQCSPPSMLLDTPIDVNSFLNTPTSEVGPGAESEVGRGD